MNRVCSIFSQLLPLFPRAECERAVKDHKAERHARGFTSWGQFVAMRFCQLGRAHSLREICGGLACCEGKLRRLGIPLAPVGLPRFVRQAVKTLFAVRCEFIVPHPGTVLGWSCR